MRSYLEIRSQWSGCESWKFLKTLLVLSIGLLAVVCPNYAYSEDAVIESRQFHYEVPEREIKEDISANWGAFEGGSFEGKINQEWIEATKELGVTVQIIVSEEFAHREKHADERLALERILRKNEIPFEIIPISNDFREEIRVQARAHVEEAGKVVPESIQTELNAPEVQNSRVTGVIKNSQGTQVYLGAGVVPEVALATALTQGLLNHSKLRKYLTFDNLHAWNPNGQNGAVGKVFTKRLVLTLAVSGLTRWFMGPLGGASSIITEAGQQELLANALGNGIGVAATENVRSKAIAGDISNWTKFNIFLMTLPFNMMDVAGVHIASLDVGGFEFHASTGILMASYLATAYAIKTWPKKFANFAVKERRLYKALKVKLAKMKIKLKNLKELKIKLPRLKKAEKCEVLLLDAPKVE